MRVILDTSVLVSDLMHPKSVPGHAVRAWREGRFDLVPTFQRFGRRAVDAYNRQHAKEHHLVTVTVRIPESLLNRARETTGQRDAASAVRRAVELATGGLELKAAARRALAQSRREEREGKVRRFRSARDGVAHLKRV